MKYKVNAGHIAPEYILNDRVIEVDYRDYRKYGGREEYSVTLPRFGTSKSYSTARAAIYGLLGDNGCYAIRIEEEV